jgi:hypothetical protein
MFKLVIQYYIFGQKIKEFSLLFKNDELGKAYEISNALALWFKNNRDYEYDDGNNDTTLISCEKFKFILNHIKDKVLENFSETEFKCNDLYVSVFIADSGDFYTNDLDKVLEKELKQLTIKKII